MLILLDIDGVMVSAKSWSSPMILEDGFSAFKSKAVEALNIIIAQTNADILLTTSHKHSFTLEEWKSIFIKRGLKFNNIDRLPKNNEYLNRLKEITNWYKRTDIVDFIIIDDDKSLGNLPISLRNKWIQTSPYIGLTLELADDALKIAGVPEGLIL